MINTKTTRRQDRADDGNHGNHGNKGDVMTQAHWDSQSGVRERLALLAEIGPFTYPENWGYHSHKDEWYACGPKETRPNCQVLKVKQEGTASLDLIAKRWSMDREQALVHIGYPEK